MNQQARASTDNAHLGLFPGNKPFRVLGKVGASPGRRRGSAPSKRVPHTESANSYPSYLRSTTNTPSRKVTLYRVGLINATWLGLKGVACETCVTGFLLYNNSDLSDLCNGAIYTENDSFFILLIRMNTNGNGTLMECNFFNGVALLKTHVTSALDLLRAGMTLSVDAVGKSRNWLLNTDVSEDNQK
ncbi:hypothetical protein CDAR_407231 [Caerostris darwini]|uniref:Uncharacterized protein n=1 Tax=Caerostris darwini TaxID=1538125 RepID=A0AAV4Q3A1_9ARAC|nr:hypothetical protein CDAR_407231 [Caerostris darwini]